MRKGLSWQGSCVAVALLALSAACRALWGCSCARAGMPEAKAPCLAREHGCPRGKEEKTTVPSLNRKSKGRFWCIPQQVFSRFINWVPLQNSCQHFIYAPHAHLELQKLSSLLLFPVFVINAAIRPSTPRHREAAPCSACRTVPRPVESLPQEHHGTPSHSHPGSSTAPSSARRCDFFPSAGSLGSSGLWGQPGDGLITTSGRIISELLEVS